MKVAIVYDRVNKWGGAERILLTLHRMFPDAPLYTSVYNSKQALWAKVFNVKTSFLQKFPFASSSHEWLAFLMPLAFESFTFDEFDLVISVTSEAAKGIITKTKTKHICICLTPTRYLWSGYEHYFRNSVMRFLTKPMIWYLRIWDKIAAQRPDVMVAISKEVQRRIEKYYERESVLIYPGVELASTGYKPAPAIENQEAWNYFLVVSRLSRFTSYKRIDLAIRAVNKISVNLKIIGTGKDLAYFKSLAGATIDFLGDINDRELVEYYRKAKALIFPGVEDFGLVMVEAQLFGTPVIAFRGGGALEIVREGTTGEFFDKQDVRSLAKALENFNHLKYNRKDCVENARRFSKSEFEKRLRNVIKQISKF